MWKASIRAHDDPDDFTRALGTHQEHMPFGVRSRSNKNSVAAVCAERDQPTLRPQVEPGQQFAPGCEDSSDDHGRPAEQRQMTSAAASQPNAGTRDGNPPLASIALMGLTQAAAIFSEDNVRQVTQVAWAKLVTGGAVLSRAWLLVRAREVEFCKTLGLSGALERVVDGFLLMATAFISVVGLCLGLHVGFLAIAGGLMAVSLLLGLSSGIFFAVSAGVLVFVSLVAGPGAIFAGTLVMGLVSVVVVPSATHFFKDRFLATFSENLYGEEAIAEMEQETSFEFVHGGEVDGGEKDVPRTKSKSGMIMSQHAEAKASSSSDKRLLWARKCTTDTLAKSTDQAA